MSDRDLIRVFGEAWEMTLEKEEFWDENVLESVIQVDDGYNPPSVLRLYLPHGQYEDDTGKVFEPDEKIIEIVDYDQNNSPVKRELSYKDKLDNFIKQFIRKLNFTMNDKALFYIIDNFPEYIKYIEFDPEVKKRYLTYRTMSVGDVLEEQGIAQLPASIIINYENGGALGLEETIRVLNSRMGASERPLYKSPE